MAYANLKFSIGETVLLVRKADQEIPEGINTVQVTKAEIRTIEISKDSVVYILTSGHHCAAEELFDELYQNSMLAAINTALA